jgi:hypothetical protein
VCGILFEAWAVPIRVSQAFAPPHYRAPSPVLQTAATLGPIYERIRDLPAGTVLAEFPFGEPIHDVRFAFVGGFHRKPIINGASGFFPSSFEKRQPILSGVPEDRPLAWRTLLDSGATHAVVHEGLFNDNSRGRDLSEWLREFGARELLVDGSDHLFHLK